MTTNLKKDTGLFCRKPLYPEILQKMDYKDPLTVKKQMGFKPSMNWNKHLEEGTMCLKNKKLWNVY